VRQLNYIRPGVLEWHDVTAPALESDVGALVRPLLVSTCDMDGVVISGRVPLRGPVPVGHEGVAEVLEVGANVRLVKPADQVLVPWKISCGFCANCAVGHTAHCLTVPREAAYGWGPTSRENGGFLADVVAVPFADHMLCPLPAGVAAELAVGVADNITDAWRAVGPPLNARPGGSVLIAGGAGPGSIGLFAAGLAVALGAGRVVYLDDDPERVSIAARIGAETLSRDAYGESGETFDVTVDASGDPGMPAQLLLATEANGVCTSTAAATYAGRDVALPMLHMYRQALTFTTGWAHTRAIMEAPLQLLADRLYDPSPVLPSPLPFSAAVDALTDPFVKLLFASD
jgi:alcohol dehydrogenase